MNKVQKILAASCALALAFTFGCASKSPQPITMQPSGQQTFAEQKQVTIMQTPCLAEAFDTDGFMVGFGVSTPRVSQNNATLEANRFALNDMTSRFVGAMKNVVSAYNNVDIPGGKKIDQQKFEDLSLTIGEKIVNKYAKRICLEYTTDANGAYKAYQTLQIPLDNALESVASELEVLKIAHNRKLLMDIMNAELKAQGTR